MTPRDPRERLKRLSENQRRELLRLLQADAAAKSALPAIGRRREAGPPPLSYAQRRLWFLEQLAPGTAAYNLAFAVHLEGPLAVRALARSLVEIVSRHEVLRARIVAVAGEPHQEIANDPTVACSVVDLSAPSAAIARGEGRRLSRAVARRPFDLETGPLLRALLLRFGATSHTLTLTVHHSSFDGASTGVLLRELAELYPSFRSGRPARLAPLPIQYGDYALWQRGRLEGGELAAHLDFWRRSLSGAPALLELPTDRPRPSAQTFRGGRRMLHLSAGLVADLDRLARAVGATLFAVLVAAFQAFLGRLTGRADPIIGMPVGNRRFPELEPLIGLFVNTLPLRGDLAGNSGLRRLAADAGRAIVEAFDHAELPFERMVDELGLARSLSYNPLVQVLLALEDSPTVGRIASGGLEIAPEPEEDRGSSQFDLTLSLARIDGALVGGFELALDLFDPSTIERWSEGFARLLAAAAAAPEAPLSGLDLLGAVGRHQLLVEWGGGSDGGAPEGNSGASLADLFLRVAEDRPDAVALVVGDAFFTYRGLARRSERVARRLRRAGVGLGSRVALCLDRGANLVVGIVGVLACGTAYVPLDPRYPRERLEWLAGDAGAELVIVEAETAASFGRWAGRLLRLGDGEAEVADGFPAFGPVPAEAPAYVIYTSGSTGRPKGVVVSHRNVTRLFAATRFEFEFDSTDVWTLFHSASFDFSVWELWGALLYGGRAVMVGHEIARSPHDFHNLLIRERATVLNQTPSAFRQLLRAEEGDGAPPQAPALRWVIFGGEALEPRILAPWVARYGDDRPGLVNMYGITETTVHVTYRRLRREDVAAGGSAIGLGIRDLSLRVLDAGGVPVPLGVAGHLHVGGAGLASGYLDRPMLTAERFIPDPFEVERGGRLYRTGDLVRWRCRADLEYLGRIDRQVKIRGFRIELGEIESTLASLPALREAAVVADGGSEHGRLVAFVVAAPGRRLAVDELRAELVERLPEHMVPAVFVELAALPLTPNGKLDRRALPSPEEGRILPAGDRDLPETPVEEVLCAIFCQVLGVAEVGSRDNFFALGGDSILSLRVIAAACERGLQLTLVDLFQNQTPADLAAKLQALAEAGGDGEAERVGPLGLIAAEDLRLLPKDVEDAYPLAMMQAGMLYHMELSPEDPPYHNVDSWRLRAPFEAGALREAARRIAARHPILRTGFDRTCFSEPLQIVYREARLPVAITDLRAAPASEQERVISARVAHEKRRLFDFRRAPQLRLHVSLCAPEIFELTLTENHAIFDGWSLHACLAELAEIYLGLLDGGRPAEPATLATTYRDFVALERREIASAEAEQFWDRALAELRPTELTRWPSGSAPPPGPRVKNLALPVAPGLLAGLRRRARELAVPLKSVALAVHLRALALLSGRSEVVTGLVVNGRPEVPGGDRVLGLFLNTLPLRVGVEAATWADLIGRAFAAERALLAHRRYPLAALQRRFGNRPLFEVSFNYTRFHVAQSLLGSGRIEILAARGMEGASLPLTVHFSLSPDGGRLDVHYEHDSHHFSWPRVEAFARVYQRVLAAVADSEVAERTIPALQGSERHQVLREWNDSSSEPAGDLLDLFEAQVALAPEAVALVSESLHLSFQELNRSAERVAVRLARLGVGAESVVGLCAQRSAAQIAGLLGILKRNAVYLPLDPEFPPARLAWISTDAGASRVLVGGAPTEQPAGLAAPLEPLETALAEQVGAAGTAPASVRLPAGLAYVIYTSGSSGRPKGVMVSRRAICNRVQWMLGRYPTTAADVVLQKTPAVFDASLWEIFLPLATGARLVLARQGGHLDPTYLVRTVREQQVSILQLMPSLLGPLLDEPDLLRCRSLRLLFCGGEALGASLVERCFERTGAELCNLYGPTECAIDATFHRASPGGRGDSIAIGRPLANVEVYIVDSDLQPTAFGAPGELAVGGHGLARGYLDRPDLTADRFVPDPWGQAGARLYRTGDLARFLPDGTIEFLGRIDSQVKIRGVRIEPAEIDAVLGRHPEVAEAATTVRQGRSGERRLASYVVARSQTVRPEELRSYLRSELPSHMVPSSLMLMPRLPRLPSGKIDAAALPEPPGASPASPPPEGEEERLIAGIWRETLGLERVGRDDNFFDLGGHSLALVEVRRGLEKSFGGELSLVELLRHPTIRSTAELLRGGSVGQTLVGRRVEDREAEIEAGRRRREQRMSLRGQG